VSPNKLKIHAIILALNEEIFIQPLLDTIYQFCSGISVITQHDRDWYGQPVKPDKTSEIVLNYPDVKGKIHFVVRRLPDEAAARNMEMLSFNRSTYRNILSHGRSTEDIAAFHEPPDYFWILDADEMYDIKTIPVILEYLASKNPRGMRVTGYNYLRTWNRRVPREVIDFTHFGFIKPGVTFEQRRVVSWNESRLRKGMKMIGLPDWSARLYGFIQCPESIGVFHHGCWLGDDLRIRNKFDKSSHMESKQWKENSVDDILSVFVSASELPENIQKAQWPKNFFDE